jgi:hypothetical protein
VADAFVHAYFQLADQEKAKQYTAFGATKMLDDELAEVRALRKGGYGPAEADVGVVVERRARSSRGHRVRFDYAIRYGAAPGIEKRADVELAEVQKEWKVVRVGIEERN